MHDNPRKDRPMEPGPTPESPVPETWYRRSFGDEYLRVYRKRDARAARREAEFAIRALGLSAGQHVLDLACGAARHVPPLLSHGLRVTGLDRSAALLGHARNDTDGRHGVGFVRGDMRHLPFTCGFDAVLSFFTSFGYFFDEGENRRVLAEVARVLRPGGGFLLDLMDRDSVVAGLVPESEREQDGRRIRERRWLSPDGRRVEKEAIVGEPSDAKRYFESVRLYGAEEAVGVLREAGLVVSSCYGDFEGTPHARGRTARMILVGRREKTE